MGGPEYQPPRRPDIDPVVPVTTSVALRFDVRTDLLGEH
jgi:hypothetical protein